MKSRSQFLLLINCIYFNYFVGFLIFNHHIYSKSADRFVVVRDGSQIGARIMNLMNSQIVYRE